MFFKLQDETISGSQRKSVEKYKAHVLDLTSWTGTLGARSDSDVCPGSYMTSGLLAVVTRTYRSKTISR